jgi:cell division transport system ATP-binding protein
MAVRAAQGMAVIMVTHEHSLVKRFHRRVVEINNGCVVADSARPVVEAQSEAK